MVTGTVTGTVTGMVTGTTTGTTTGMVVTGETTMEGATKTTGGHQTRRMATREGLGSARAGADQSKSRLPNHDLLGQAPPRRRSQAVLRKS